MLMLVENGERDEHGVGGRTRRGLVLQDLREPGSSCARSRTTHLSGHTPA